MASPMRSSGRGQRQRQSSGFNPGPGQKQGPSQEQIDAPSPWINPCKLNAGHSLDPSKDFAGAPKVPVSDLINEVLTSAKRAKHHAIQIKTVFLNNTFNDPDFEEGVKNSRQDWLPDIVPPSMEEFLPISTEEAFKRSFKYMQYFAVGLEQILMDQVFHEGRFLSQFKTIQEDLIQVLCEIQLGMTVQRIRPDKHILKDVMSHNFRDISETSLRNLRDYLILRDYIKAVDYIAELFAFLKTKT